MFGNEFRKKATLRFLNDLCDSTLSTYGQPSLELFYSEWGPYLQYIVGYILGRLLYAIYLISQCDLFQVKRKASFRFSETFCQYEHYPHLTSKCEQQIKFCLNFRQYANKENATAVKSWNSKMSYDSQIV